MISTPGDINCRKFHGNHLIYAHLNNAHLIHTFTGFAKYIKSSSIIMEQEGDSNMGGGEHFRELEILSMLKHGQGRRYEAS